MEVYIIVRTDDGRRGAYLWGAGAVKDRKRLRHASGCFVDPAVTCEDAADAARTAVERVERGGMDSAAV